MKPEAVLRKRFSVRQLLDGCAGRRNRECLFRLCKEAAIRAQDFESAMYLRAWQNANLPAPRAPGKRGAR